MFGETSTVGISSLGDAEQPAIDEAPHEPEIPAAPAGSWGARSEVLLILSVIALAHAVGLFYSNHFFGGLILLALGIAGLTGKRITQLGSFGRSTYWNWVGDCHQQATQWLSSKGCIERCPFDSRAYQRYDAKLLHLSEVAALESIFVVLSLSSQSIDEHLEATKASVHMVGDTKYRANTAFSAVMLSLAATEPLPPELLDVAHKGLGLGFLEKRERQSHARIP